MPRRLSWLPQALTDLVRLREFIRLHNPAAAERAANCIRKATIKLLDHPLIGLNVTDILIVPDYGVGRNSLSEAEINRFCNQLLWYE